MRAKTALVMLPKVWKICINMTLQPYHTKIKTSGRAAQELKYDTRGNIVGAVDGNQNRTQYRMDE